MAINRQDALAVVEDFKQEFPALANLNYVLLGTEKDFHDHYGKNAGDPMLKIPTRPNSLGLVCDVGIPDAYQRLKHQRNRPAHDSDVGDVEGRPMQAAQMEVKVVNDMSAYGAVESVAQCPSQDETVRDAFPFVQRTGKLPCQPRRHRKGDCEEEPSLPAARARKEAERGAGVENVDQVEKLRDLKRPPQSSRHVDVGLGSLISDEYDDRE